MGDRHISWLAVVIGVLLAATVIAAYYNGRNQTYKIKEQTQEIEMLKARTGLLTGQLKVVENKYSICKKVRQVTVEKWWECKKDLEANLFLKVKDVVRVHDNRKRKKK